MHHDFFAWVRLLLLVIMILLFAAWGAITENQSQMEQPKPKEAEQKEPIYIVQAASYEIIPTEAETATEPTSTTHTEEITPATEAATTATEPPTEPIPTETWKSLGVFELTAYCSCEKCCGQWATNRPTDQSGNPIVYTSTGAIAKAGTTIAVDPRVIPYGSEIQIDGHTYIAQDCGGAIKGNRIDVYHDSHQAALVFGRQQSESSSKPQASETHRVTHHPSNPLFDSSERESQTPIFNQPPERRTYGQETNPPSARGAE